MFAFGRSSPSVSAWLPASLFGWLVRQLGSLPPIFSLTFSFGVVVAPWFLVGVLQRFSPPGGFLLQFS